MQLLIGLLLAASASATASGKFLVVIDPGHGGADFGAGAGTGKDRVYEKNVTLAIARETARALQALKIQVALTRDTDVELPLSVRTAFANRLKADVFVSIHLNSSPQSQIPEGGAETYILNNATDESSKRLAHLENSVLGGSPELSNESTDVALILKDLRLDANLPESKRLACLLQTGQGGKRGIKQALFFVLLGADMPSALFEAGFLNAPKDRARVTNEASLRALGDGLAAAIARFRQDKGTPRARATVSSCPIHGQ
jgi:N-acetylmuramoyl-L-alanine amidase